MRIIQRHVDWWHGYDTLLVTDPPRLPQQTEVEELKEWIGVQKPLTYVPIPFEDFAWLKPLRQYPHERWEVCSLPEDLTGQTVMDVGCSLGYYGFLAAAAGARVVLVESNLKAGYLLRSLVTMYGLEDKVEVRNEPFTPDVIRSSRPDVILAFSVLGHIGRHYQELLKDILRAMAEVASASYIEMGDGKSSMPWCEGDEQFAQLFRDCGFAKVSALQSVFVTHTGTIRTIWRCGDAWT